MCISLFHVTKRRMFDYKLHTVSILKWYENSKMIQKFLNNLLQLIEISIMWHRYVLTDPPALTK